MDRKTIAVIFGGQSTEHEVSCMSVVNVVKSMDVKLWDPVLVGITKDGRWLLTDSIESIMDGSWENSRVNAEISPSSHEKCLILTDGSGSVTRQGIDAVFPVLHGKLGEDGTIQGLFEMAKIPYVGCGTLASAVSMDKFYTKLIVEAAGIRQAGFIGLRAYEFNNEKKRAEILKQARERFGFPVFVKPSRAGSSVGTGKAENEEELISCVTEALKVDSKVLIEEFIAGREVECAVLGGGNEKVRATGIGEILTAAGSEFYDYEAKYHNADSKTVIDPDIPQEVVEEIRAKAAAVFNAVDGYGLSRVDFFVRDNNEVVFNEINTIPGFTDISMYPMLWESRGLSQKDLITELIELGLRRELL